jgi:hypothetical protein
MSTGANNLYFRMLPHFIMRPWQSCAIYQHRFSGLIMPFISSPGHSSDTPKETRHGEQQIFRRMPSYGMLRRVALVRTDVSEELSASFSRVTQILVTLMMEALISS